MLFYKKVMLESLEISEELDMILISIFHLLNLEKNPKSWGDKNRHPSRNDVVPQGTTIFFIFFLVLFFSALY